MAHVQVSGAPRSPYLSASPRKSREMMARYGFETKTPAAPASSTHYYVFHFFWDLLGYSSPLTCALSRSRVAKLASPQTRLGHSPGNFGAGVFMLRATRRRRKDLATAAARKSGRKGVGRHRYSQHQRREWACQVLGIVEAGDSSGRGCSTQATRPCA